MASAGTRYAGPPRLLPIRRCMFFFFQAEDGIRDVAVTGVQTCALPISYRATDTFVVRGGYGITNDPFNIARSLRANVPVLLPFIQTGPNSRVPVGHLQDGITQIVVPHFSTGVASIAGQLGLKHTYTGFLRGYDQPW